MRIIKAMAKALLAMSVIIGVATLIAFIVRVCQIDPMVALGAISLIGLFAAFSIAFYVTDDKK